MLHNSLLTDFLLLASAKCIVIFVIFSKYNGAITKRGINVTTPPPPPPLISLLGFKEILRFQLVILLLNAGRAEI